MYLHVGAVGDGVDGADVHKGLQHVVLRGSDQLQGSIEKGVRADGESDVSC